MSRNAQSRSLKNDINECIFGYMFAKNRYINLIFGMLDARAWFYNMLYVFLKILDFGKLKILFFLVLGVKKHFWGRIRDCHLKELYILCLLVIFICILL